MVDIVTDVSGMSPSAEEFRAKSGWDTPMVEWAMGLQDSLLLIAQSPAVGGALSVNTNIPAGATAQQLTVLNPQGQIVGYIPVYAAPW